MRREFDSWRAFTCSAPAKLLRNAGIDQKLINSETRPTTHKLRILAGKHQMLRVDKEESSAADEDLESRISTQSKKKSCQLMR